MGGEVDGPDGIRAAVRERVKDGADFIKVAASGGSTLTSDPYRASFSLEELKVIVEEAHNRNRPVLAHCRCTESINFALDAGVDAILHCFFTDSDGSYRYDEPTADRLAETGVWLNPTMHLGRVSRAYLQLTMSQRPPDSRGAGTLGAFPAHGQHRDGPVRAADSRGRQDGRRLRLRLGQLSLRRFPGRDNRHARRRTDADAGDTGGHPQPPPPRWGRCLRQGSIEPGKAADLLLVGRRPHGGHQRAAAGAGGIQAGEGSEVGHARHSHGLNRTLGNYLISPPPP